MNWFKISQKQLSLFETESSEKKEPSKKEAQPQVTIWGLSPSGTLTVIINGEKYEYYNVTPHEEAQLNTLLKHKNYKRVFAILQQLSNRRTMVEPFRRTL